MWQTIALSTGRKLRQLPDTMRKNHLGPLREVWDTPLEFAAYRRVLDRDEPDYKT